MTFKGGKIEDVETIQNLGDLQQHTIHAVFSMPYIHLYIPIHNFTMKIHLLPAVCSFVLSLKKHIVKCTT